MHDDRNFFCPGTVYPMEKAYSCQAFYPKISVLNLKSTFHFINAAVGKEDPKLLWFAMFFLSLYQKQRDRMKAVETQTELLI